MGIMRDHIIPAPMRHTEVMQSNTQNNMLPINYSMKMPLQLVCMHSLHEVDMLRNTINLHK